MNKIIIGLISLSLSLPTFAHGLSEETKPAMVEGGYLQYILLGAGLTSSAALIKL